MLIKHHLKRASESQGTDLVVVSDKDFISIEILTERAKKIDPETFKVLQTQKGLCYVEPVVEKSTGNTCYLLSNVVDPTLGQSILEDLQELGFRVEHTIKKPFYVEIFQALGLKKLATSMWKKRKLAIKILKTIIF